MKRLFMKKMLLALVICCFLSTIIIQAAESGPVVNVQIKNTSSNKKIQLIPEQTTKKFLGKKVNILGKSYKRNDYKINGSSASDDDDDEKNYKLNIVGKKALTASWQYYEFSFTTDKSGYLMIELSGIAEDNKKYSKIDEATNIVAYDYFKVTGAYLYNTNFEFIDKKTLRGWFNNGLLLKNSDEAINGNYFVATIGRHSLHRSFKVKKDKKVTIAFFAKNYDVNSDDIIRKATNNNQPKKSKKTKKKVVKIGVVNKNH